MALDRRGEWAVPIHPPWAAPRAQFLSQCTRCGDCLNACPTKVLVRGEGGHPEVSFHRGGCTFCGRCVASCPTGALDRDGGRPRPWQLTARIGSTCLASRRVECRVCGEGCEARAIRFVLSAGSVALPSVLSEDCTGCGMCVANCPMHAIRLEHVTAKIESV